jgi:transcriptional regulator with XRE-family HTH domain
VPRDPQPDWVIERRRRIGIRIRNARLDADLTQEKLAEQAGISPLHVLRIEYGTTDATISVLLRIADAVRVPLRDLVD